MTSLTAIGLYGILEMFDDGHLNMRLKYVDVNLLINLYLLL